MVNDTQRANERLKQFRDTCTEIAQKGGTAPKALEKPHRLWEKHRREFARNSTLGRDLKVALEHFETALVNGADRDTLFDRAEAVNSVVYTIWRERWRQVERRRGKIDHMFDGFGKIKT